MKIIQTRDTMNDIYIDSMKIRQKVFVEEQAIPLSIEIDEFEAFSVHFVLYDNDNFPIATARLLPDKDLTSAKIQRMAVLKEFRTQHYGHQLILEMERFAKEKGISFLTLHAQLSAQVFYEKLGYLTKGEPFDEANIQHIAMEKSL